MFILITLSTTIHISFAILRIFKSFPFWCVPFLVISFPLLRCHSLISGILAYIPLF
ncbi:unnamed protein product [Brugia timori]|uniref:Uncharacterized protein n=1 Tax=Brugia timori TaxID=42155 RepID=A0A3P7VDB1_9BILA|nr:unnamed protein product [Brugia timori]